jgi:mono/diheme cytochrome c family protein
MLAGIACALASASGCKKAEGATMQTRELFTNTCARCHGAEGTGGLPVYEAGPSPQNFHDHAFQMSRTDEQLKQIIKNGKGTGMPAFGPLLNDEQIAQLVIQIRSFDGGNEK